MYEQHFGLKETPFSIAPNPRFLYMSNRHREALAHLLYGVSNDGGFVLLTGEVGTGKTTISRCLLEQIPENANIAVVLNPKVAALELLATICDELHIEYPNGFNSIKTYVDRIYRYLLEQNAIGRRTVVIIEESQNLTIDVLEQLRMLTNLETDQRKLMQIIMIGQPELLELLALPELRQLEQRITARYHLQPLSLRETLEYIEHRLRIAGMQGAVFNAAALKRIHKLSGGVPRRINLLCDRAMLGAYVGNTREIDVGMINRAAVEVFGDAHNTIRGRAGGKKIWLKWISAIVIISIAGAGFGISLAYLKKRNQQSQDDDKQAELAKSESKTAVPVPGQIITGTLDVMGKPSITSKEAAYKSLFRAWNVDYEAGMGESFCDVAETFGLKCLEQSGGLASLRNTNRPAVLKLKTLGDKAFYITVTGVGDESIAAEINGKREVIPVAELNSLWQGEFTIFWRAPPNYKGPIVPGSRGPDVLWLANQVALIVGRKLSKDENREYDTSLTEDVKAFQSAQGLTADGIAGSLTLIHLNSEVFEDTPMLSSGSGISANPG